MSLFYNNQEGDNLNRVSSPKQFGIYYAVSAV